jgi:phosphoglucose isomerase-like protein
VTVATDLVERIWERDPTVWTGNDEAQWLGWLDEPLRMQEQLDGILEFANEVVSAGAIDDVVVLGMGGSSLAPEVMRRAFGAERFHVLDTTHPRMIRRLEEQLDVERTLFLSASKSGSTLETRCHTAYFLAKGGQFAAITDPGSPLESFAHENGFLRVFHGEPTIGGRYSALSPFGIVPAVLMGVDATRFLERAQEMREACRFADGNPGLELGLRLGEASSVGLGTRSLDMSGGAPADERSSPPGHVQGPGPYGFGLWVEQLIAESTGKEGKGILPAPDDPHAQLHEEVRLPDPYELAQEFFRWEFAVAVAGSMIGINPFDQPNVQAAKDKTNEVLAQGDVELDSVGSLEVLLAHDGDYVCIQAFTDYTRVDELDAIVQAARASGRIVTHGFGPRYLHSTGQFHKGGPNTGLFLQVVDDVGDELPIPGQPFGFAQLIRAQAAGDFASLRERGRRVARIKI